MFLLSILISLIHPCRITDSYHPNLLNNGVHELLHVISNVCIGFVDLPEVTGLMGSDGEDSESSEQPSVD